MIWSLVQRILASDALEWIATIGGALMAFAGLLLRSWWQDRQVRADERRDITAEALEKSHEKAQRGREEIERSRDSGNGDLTPDERLRRYDGRW